MDLGTPSDGSTIHVSPCLICTVTLSYMLELKSCFNEPPISINTTTIPAITKIIPSTLGENSKFNRNHFLYSKDLFIISRILADLYFKNDFK